MHLNAPAPTIHRFEGPGMLLVRVASDGGLDVGGWELVGVIDEARVIMPSAAIARQARQASPPRLEIEIANVSIATLLALRHGRVGDRYRDRALLGDEDFNRFLDQWLEHENCPVPVQLNAVTNRLGELVEASIDQFEMTSVRAIGRTGSQINSVSVSGVMRMDPAGGQDPLLGRHGRIRTVPNEFTTRFG